MTDSNDLADRARPDLSWWHSKLEERRALFEATRDPRELWAAYWLCRSVGITPLPAWVLAEFDAMAHRLLKYSSDRYLPGFRERRHWTRVVAEIFGFRAPTVGGPTDPFRIIDRAAPEDLAVRVRVKVDGDGHNETDACYLVANELAVSQPTVRRAWKKFAAAVRVVDLEVQRSAIEDARASDN